MMDKRRKTQLEAALCLLITSAAAYLTEGDDAEVEVEEPKPPPQPQPEPGTDQKPERKHARKPLSLVFEEATETLKRDFSQITAEPLKLDAMGKLRQLLTEPPGNPPSSISVVDSPNHQYTLDSSSILQVTPYEAQRKKPKPQITREYPPRTEQNAQHLRSILKKYNSLKPSPSKTVGNQESIKVGDMSVTKLDPNNSSGSIILDKKQKFSVENFVQAFQETIKKQSDCGKSALNPKFVVSTPSGPLFVVDDSLKPHQRNTKCSKRKPRDPEFLIDICSDSDGGEDLPHAQKISEEQKLPEELFSETQFTVEIISEDQANELNPQTDASESQVTEVSSSEPQVDDECVSESQPHFSGDKQKEEGNESIPRKRGHEDPPALVPLPKQRKLTLGSILGLGELLDADAVDKNSSETFSSRSPAEDKKNPGSQFTMESISKIEEQFYLGQEGSNETSLSLQVNERDSSKVSDVNISGAQLPLESQPAVEGNVIQQGSTSSSCIAQFIEKIDQPKQDIDKNSHLQPAKDRENSGPQFTLESLSQIEEQFYSSQADDGGSSTDSAEVMIIPNSSQPPGSPPRTSQFSPGSQPQPSSSRVCLESQATESPSTEESHLRTSSSRLLRLSQLQTPMPEKTYRENSSRPPVSSTASILRIEIPSSEGKVSSSKADFTTGSRIPQLNFILLSSDAESEAERISPPQNKTDSSSDSDGGPSVDNTVYLDGSNGILTVNVPSVGKSKRGSLPHMDQKLIKFAVIHDHGEPGGSSPTKSSSQSNDEDSSEPHVNEDESRRPRVGKVMRRTLLETEPHPELSSLLRKEVALMPTLNYSDFIPMTHEDFAELYNLLEKSIVSYSTILKETLSPVLRLALTLRYLTCAEPYSELESATGLYALAIARIISEVYKAMLSTLGPAYFQEPKTAEDWLAVSSGFETLWGYPMCLGAIGARRILAMPPSSKGVWPRTNPNRTKMIDIITICDAEHKFLHTEIVVNGKADNDAGLWKSCSFYKEMDKKYFPPCAPLPGRSEPVSYHFIADSVFELSPRVMRPFIGSKVTRDEKLYNERLMSALEVSNRAFSVLASRFKVFRQAINLDAQNVIIPLMTCICLHNFLLSRNPNSLYLNDEGLTSPGFMIPPKNDPVIIAYPQAFEQRNEIKNFLCL